MCSETVCNLSYATIKRSLKRDNCFLLPTYDIFKCFIIYFVFGFNFWTFSLFVHAYNSLIYSIFLYFLPHWAMVETNFFEKYMNFSSLTKSFFRAEWCRKKIWSFLYLFCWLHWLHWANIVQKWKNVEISLLML